MGRIPQSIGELQEHLADQISFLKASSEAFDKGLEGEAKRLAVALRVLLHDGKGNSKSLLGQLGLKDQLFYDTRTPEIPNINIATSYSGLTATFLGVDSVKHVPYLDENPSVLVDFEIWWQGTVFRDTEGNTLSRRALVLSLAEQDGGAHVDSSLNELYAKISRYNSLGLLIGDGKNWTPVKHLERPATRQIAHEVLKTLEPGYVRTHTNLGDGYLIGGFDFHMQPAPKIPNEPQIPQVGRNVPCPCGSGMKYKKCHGKLG